MWCLNAVDLMFWFIGIALHTIKVSSSGYYGFNQHHLERRPVHKNVETWQTSEVVGKAPKNCNSYPDAIFK